MNILLFGGTHGNEWTGIYLLKDKEIGSQIPSQNLVLSNPMAFEQSKRFVDYDLNRSFTKELLNSDSNKYEIERAKEISKLINETESPVIIDMHTTTSNMGKTILFSNTNRKQLAYLSAIQKIHPDLKLIYAKDPTNKYLISQSDISFTIEVGPIANNNLNALVYDQTKEIVLNLIEIIKNDQECTDSFDVFEFHDLFKYEYQNEQLNSMVHPEFQGCDFQALTKGQVILRRFDGSDIYFNEEGVYYPIFINESAYYSYSYAFELTTKKKWTVS